MSWNQLLSIIKEEREVENKYRQMRPVCCPNDGNQLVQDKDGRLFCQWDGWHEDRGGGEINE